MARRFSKESQAALDQAQDLIYEAWEAPTVPRRLELAKKALSLSSHCADAYCLLAQHEVPDSDAALELWRAAVAAGEQALGPAGFKDFAGHFWGFLETRPYMRARSGLAHTLWRRGTRDEAVEHLRAMLVLNPGDNQGTRYVLAAHLAEMDRNDALGELLAQYPDEWSAAWSWTAALLAFRRTGDSDQARERLAEAETVNAHVRDYLIGERPLPKRLPPFLSPGQPDEAVHYVAEHRSGWTRTSGALDWMRARTPAATKPARARRKPTKPKVRP